MYGNIAKKIRTQLRLQQKELAEIAHVSRNAVNMLENNEPLKLEDRQKILAYLYAEKVKITRCN